MMDDMHSNIIYKIDSIVTETVNKVVPAVLEPIRITIRNCTAWKSLIKYFFEKEKKENIKYIRINKRNTAAFFCELLTLYFIVISEKADALI